MLKCTHHPEAPIQVIQEQLLWHNQVVAPNSMLSSNAPDIRPLPQDNTELVSLLASQKHLILLVARDPFSSTLSPLINAAIRNKQPFERIHLNAIASIATILIHDQRPFHIWYCDSSQ